nr:choice-of-anchor Q domain-containing protein [Luteolibacter marinus]
MASDGGGVYNGNSSPVLTNCSFQGNKASLAGGAILQNGGTTTATNCIFWNNRQNGSTTAPGASVATVAGTVTYSHCLVQNLNPAGTGNLDGTNPANDPLFLTPVDPASAPTTGGDLRLQPASPCIDRGDDSANPSTTDLAGNSRFIGTIDLGAYETPAADLWDTDYDHDGLAWGIENALGTDTTLPTYPSPFTAPTFDTSGNPLLTFPNNPAAVPGTIWVLQRSTDLTGFTEIWRSNGVTLTNQPDTSSTLLDNIFTITDTTTPPDSRVFYRFGALHQPAP